MIVSLIVAVGKNGEIGKNNQLLWRLPGDLARFKAITMGHTLIMGRKTFESIGRPLPGRKTLVVSSTGEYQSIEAAIEAAQAAGESEVFIAGGASVYKEAMEKGLCDRLYITEVDYSDADADTYFHWSGGAGHQELSREYFPKDEKNLYSCTLIIYQRRD